MIKVKSTNGKRHYFSAGDQIKYYPEDSGLIYYGDVVRVNKKSITVKLNDWQESVIRVCPSQLNFD